MTDRLIATVEDYAQLMKAFRLRIAELGTTGEAVDHLAGLPLRYTMKILGPRLVKGTGSSVGRTSLGPLLGALGLKLLVVEDTEKLARIAHRLEKTRATGSVLRAEGKARRRHFSVFKGNPDLARALRQSQMLGQSPERRRDIARMARMSQSPERRKEAARKAANARWAKYRQERAAA